MKSLFDTPLKYKTAFVFILLAGLLFRIANLGEYSFFSDYDEYFTVKTVTGIYESKLQPGQCIAPSELQPNNATEMLEDSMRDFGNNTLYNFMLGAYSRAVGFSDFKLRLFSVFFGLLSIVLVHFIGREMNVSNPYILVAAALMAFNPILIHYSDIIRAYSWGVFLTMLYFFFHIQVLKEPKRVSRWIWIGFIGLAMFLSHYLMVYVIGAGFLFLAYSFRKSLLQQRAMLVSYVAMGFCAVLFIVTNPRFIENISDKNAKLQQQAIQTDDAQKSRKIEHITLRSFTEGTVSYLNQYYCYSYLPLGLSGKIFGPTAMLVTGLLLLALPAILFYILLRSHATEPIKLAMFICLAANLMVLVLVLLSKHSVSFSIKYTLFSIPLYLLAIAFSSPKKRLYTLALAATAVISFSSCVNAVINNYQKPIALTVNGQSHEILPQHRMALTDLISNPEEHTGRCVSVHSLQDYIFVAHACPEWQSVEVCIAGDSMPLSSCDTLGVRFRLTH